MLAIALHNIRLPVEGTASRSIEARLKFYKQRRYGMVSGGLFWHIKTRELKCFVANAFQKNIDKQA